MALLDTFISSGGSSLKTSGIARAGFALGTTGVKLNFPARGANVKYILALEVTDNGVTSGKVKINGNLFSNGNVSSLFNRKYPIVFQSAFNEEIEIEVTEASSIAGNAYVTVYEMTKD